MDMRIGLSLFVFSAIIVCSLSDDRQTEKERLKSKSSLDTTNEANDADVEEEVKRANVFRYGRKRGSTVFRYGKRPAVFRYGKRFLANDLDDQDSEEQATFENEPPSFEQKRIFRYGKRSADEAWNDGENDDEDLDNTDSSALLEEAGKRKIFRYGKRENFDGDESLRGLSRALYEKRERNAFQKFVKRPIFRYG